MWCTASEFTELKSEKKSWLHDKNSNAYILVYSTVMVIVVAALLAVTALSLQERQHANTLNEKKDAISLRSGQRSRLMTIIFQPMRSMLRALGSSPFRQMTLWNCFSI